MGRLEQIIERNKHPGRHRKMKVPYRMMISLLVLVVLILAIFTDLGRPPQDPAPARDHSRVEGVQLRKVPTRDAAAD